MIFRKGGLALQGAGAAHAATEPAGPAVHPEAVRPRSGKTGPREGLRAALQLDSSLHNLRRRGDLYLVGVSALQAVVLLAVGQYYNAVGLASILSMGLLAAAMACFILLRGTWANSVLLPLILAAFVAAEIHIGMGKAEFHFGVFVTLAILQVYRHWLPIVVGAAAFAVHHLSFDRLQAMGFPVYCLTSPSIGDVLVHAGYVVAQAGVGIVMVVQMRRDALLMDELERLTAGLSARGKGTVDFSALAMPVTTGSALRLRAVLDQVRGALRAVSGSVTAVTDASRELAQGNLDLSGRTEQAASALQSTASLLQSHTEELTGSAARTHDMNRATRLSLELAQGASRSAQELSDRMAAITRSASRIFEITGTIDTIAFQTNILALNAAVESARAGEAGRGFAVVAAEVRQLAQRSATAAKEVRSLIDGSAKEIQAGAAVAEVTRKALADIDTQALSVAEGAEALSRSLSDQAQGITAVNITVGELDRNTQHNAALVEQTAATAESLAYQARMLEQAMRGLHGVATASPQGGSG